MSCCGSKRQQAVSSVFAGLKANGAASAGSVGSASAPPAHGSTGVLFVYDGMAGISVIGRVTGRRYHFGERGARLTVDPRDAPALEAIPKLRRLFP